MVVQLCNDLKIEKEYNLSNQLFRSGTSIGANVREAQSPQSRADFIHKMKIAYKEAEETHYWLLLLDKSDVYSVKVKEEIRGLISIKKLLNAIISTSKRHS